MSLEVDAVSGLRPDFYYFFVMHTSVPAVTAEIVSLLTI